jgi:imidazolonepropionase-like amidohydrolase
MRHASIFASIALFMITTAVFSQQTKPAENVPPLPSDIPQNAVLYTVISAGKPAGQMALWDEQGSHHTFFQFNDRGRGPKIYSSSKTGPDQIPVSLKITGNDYYKKPADENYSLQEKTATWKSPAEQGSRTLTEKSYYVPIGGSPEEVAQLARALLANGGKLPLLPAGEARIQRLSDLTVESHGGKKTITEYAISGLDFSPSPLWLAADQTLFAVGSAWSMTIVEGWESVADQILKAQSQAENSFAADLSKRLTHAPEKPVVFYNVSVFDSINAKVLPAQTVVVNGNKIESMEASNPADLKRKDAQVIDGTGKMLLPGLWDMHVHIGGTDGILHLAAGVTTVRDLANNNDELTARRARFENGTEIGPHVIPAGIIDGRGPFQGPTDVLISTPEEARTAVDNYHRRGYPQIKIYSSVKPELVPVIIEEAHKNGQRVSGHIPAGMTAEECVRDGYNEIQHINFIILNFFPDVKETRNMSRLTVPGERAVELDPASERVQSFFHLLLDHHVDVDPTLGVFEMMLTSKEGEVSPVFKAVADRLPPQVRRAVTGGGIATPETRQRYTDSFRVMQKFVKTMYDIGIPIDAGTDNVAGFSYQRELELLSESGISASRVLQIATYGSAKIMSHENETGSIAAGKAADLVLINGDPTKNISDIRNVDVVMKNGSLFYARELDEAIGVKPQ